MILLFVYLIFGESLLQLIEVLQFQYALVLPIDVTNSRPETIFNQMGVVSAKVVVVNKRVAFLPNSSPPENNPA